MDATSITTTGYTHTRQTSCYHVKSHKSFAARKCFYTITASFVNWFSFAMTNSIGIKQGLAGFSSIACHSNLSSVALPWYYSSIPLAYMSHCALFSLFLLSMATVHIAKAHLVANTEKLPTVPAET